MNQSRTRGRRNEAYPLITPPSTEKEAAVARQIAEMRHVVGSNIKAARQAAGLSFQQMGIRSSVSANYISKLERGIHAPTLDPLVRIAAALNMTLVDLMGISKSALPSDDQDNSIP